MSESAYKAFEIEGDFLKSVGLRSDSYAPNGKYRVTSLYFDTYGNDDYYDKSAGILTRKKLRARIYGYDLDDNVVNVFLEIKHKHDMFISKDRKGKCVGCGKCCSLPKKCPFLKENSIGESYCFIYPSRFPNCRKYPRNEAEWITKGNCGYRFGN